MRRGAPVEVPVKTFAKLVKKIYYLPANFLIMSRICQLTGKRPSAGNNVSHSKRRTRRRFNVNLITKRINGVKVRMAASTWRTLKKWSREATAAESSAETK